MFCFRLWIIYIFFLVVYMPCFPLWYHATITPSFFVCREKIFWINLRLKPCSTLLPFWLLAILVVHVKQQHQCISPKADCLSVCQSVSLTYGLMYWLSTNLSFSLSVHMLEKGSSHRAKHLYTHQDLTSMGPWRYFWNEAANG